MTVMTKKIKGHTVSSPDTMLGRYLCAELEQGQAPALPTLFICTGSDGEEDARARNLDAVEGVLSALPAPLPANIVYASSWTVYSPEAGEGVDESRPLFGRGEAARWRVRTEEMLSEWCASRGVALTIVRPALMFGKGVDGAMLRLFNRAVRGHYVHIRGNDAKTSLVTALDAVRAMTRLAGTPGVFNISDGRPCTWLQLVEAMTANAGAQKRMTHLPEKWAAFIYRCFGRVPIVEECLSPKALAPFARTLTLDNSKAVHATGMKFFDTLEVISRQSTTYPYED